LKTLLSTQALIIVSLHFIKYALQNGMLESKVN
jgi:hypothetical protein